MCAVLVRVDRIAAASNSVKAVAIIDKSIAVVIDPIVKAVAIVTIDICGQVRMVPIHTRVDRAHHHVAAAGRERPRLHRVDVGARETTALPGIAQPPHLRIRI